MADKRREQLQQLLTDIATKSNQVNTLFDAADNRGDGANTSEEITQIKNLNKEIEELNLKAEELKSVMDIRDANNKRVTDLNTPNRPPFEGGNGNGNPASSSAFKSLGEQVLSNERMANWLKDVVGEVPGEGRMIQSPRVQIKSFLQRNSPEEMAAYLKTLITGLSDTSAGPLVFPDFKPIVDESYKRPLTVRDIITVGQTTSDTVEYVRVNTPTNNAAPVAEATATGDGTGAKPESALPFERISETVKTIAHWVPATNRALADAGQLRTYIDAFLRYGIDEELEDQILTGSGVGENFTGVLNVSGTTAQAWDTDILTTTRKARTKVRVTGRARPTAYVLHPTDWETIDLLQDNEARYYFGGPLVQGTPRLWGLPVVESEGMTQGTGVVADWKLAILWDRMQTSISMSNSHSDFFVRNLVAILAEMRAAFGIIRPKAFVEIDLTA